MRLPRRILFAVAVLLVALILSPSTQATLANRVFMSTNGSDSNVCANPLHPCLTFAGAQAQVAAGGEVIAEATGGYGAISITQSVTISGPPGVVIYSGYTVSVNASGATVVLRGLTIDGTGASGSGINVVAVSILHVESCVITGFTGHGIYFTSAGQLFVKDTIIRGNGGAGIYVVPTSGTAQASVDHCRLEQNDWGLYCDGSGGGTAKATIKDSVASGNTLVGLFTESGGELNAEGCLVANNDFGLASDKGGAVLRSSNCTVTDNATGIYLGSGSVLSRSNNTLEGNGTNNSFTGTYSAQ